MNVALWSLLATLVTVAPLEEPTRTTDLTPSTTDLNPENLTPLGSKLFFTVHRPDNRRAPELWMTDGTAEGSVLLAANEAPCSLPLRDLRVVNGTLFFIACGSPVEATSAQGARVELPTVTATDALFPPQVTLSHASGADFALGSTPVTATARDEAGNTSTCTFTVLVQDTTAPVVTCPADLTVDAPDRTGGLVVRFPPPEATDAVSPPTVLVSPESGRLFRPGTTQVTAVAVDAANNSAQCSFTVTVNEPGVDSGGGGGCAATPGSPASGWLLLGGLALHLGLRRRARA